MKKFGVLVVFSFLFFAVLAVAQQSPSPIPVPTPLAVSETGELPPVDGEDLKAFIDSIDGYKGLGALGIAMLIVQGLLLGLRTQFVKLPGHLKLTVASGLSIVAGVLALRISGVDLTASILHGSTLAALNTFAHQLIKQFTEKA